MLCFNGWDGDRHDLDVGQQMDRVAFNVGHLAGSVVGMRSGMKSFTAAWT